MKKKGKGLSFDQKRQRMLSVFHNTRDVFNFQEIEKLSIKSGIPYPSVKDILNSLKDDGLVQCEKIGAGVFYWSFPSRAYQTMKERYITTQKLKEGLIQQNQKYMRDIQQAKQERLENDKRSQMIEEVAELRDQLKTLSKQIQKYIRFDPQRYELLLKQNKQIALAINDEIDNIEQIKKFIKKNQIGIKNSEIEQCYGIPADLDYEDI